MDLSKVTRGQRRNLNSRETPRASAGSRCGLATCGARGSGRAGLGANKGPVPGRHRCPVRPRISGQALSPVRRAASSP